MIREAINNYGPVLAVLLALHAVLFGLWVLSYTQNDPRLDVVEKRMAGLHGDKPPSRR